MEENEYLEQLRLLKERMVSQRPAEWEDLPDLPLYMDQVVSYLGRQHITFREGEGLTSAMINNYIKDGIVPRANGKRYEKEHLAALTEVAILKQVLSVRDLATLIEHGAGAGDPERSYAAFCEVLDSSLRDAVADMERVPADPAVLAAFLALRAYANVLACRRILDLLRSDGEEQKDKKKKK